MALSAVERGIAALRSGDAAEPRDFYQSEGELLATEPAEILREFIAEQDWVLSTGRQGLIWPTHHNRIRPLFPKARRLLNPAERRRLYFHRLLLNDVFTRLDAEEYELLSAAYDDCLPILADTAITRMRAVLLFGRDERGSLPGAFAEGPGQYALGSKVWKQCGAYVSIPTMLAKVERFRPFARDPEVVRRVLATLRHLRYAPGFGHVDLHFWGMVVIVLLGGGHDRRQLLDEVSALSRSRPDDEPAGFRDILDRVVEATR